MRGILLTVIVLMCAACWITASAEDDEPLRAESFEINGIQVEGADLSYVAVHENANLVLFFRIKGRHVPASVLARGDPSLIRTIQSLSMKHGCLVIQHDKGMTSLNSACASRIEYTDKGLTFFFP